MDTKYKFRNLPCSILPDNRLWCVAGSYEDRNGSGGGILEWCYDADDAGYLMGEMKKDPRFRNLHVHKFTD